MATINNGESGASVRTKLNDDMALMDARTTVGYNVLTLANPSAIRFLRINADNSVTARTAAELITDLGIVLDTTVRPSGDITTTANTAQNITGMSFAVEANSTYFIRGYIRIGCNNTGGVKFALTVPAASSLSVNFQGSTTNNTTFGTFNAIASGTLTASPFCTENQTNRGVVVNGTIVTGANAGTVQFQFASNTATQTSTIFLEGTCIFAKKIA